MALKHDYAGKIGNARLNGGRSLEDHIAHRTISLRKERSAQHVQLSIYNIIRK